MHYAHKIILGIIVLIVVQQPLHAVESFQKQKKHKAKKISIAHGLIAASMEVISASGVVGIIYGNNPGLFYTLTISPLLIQPLLHVINAIRIFKILKFPYIIPSDNNAKKLYLQGDIASLLKQAGNSFSKHRPQLKQELKNRKLGIFCLKEYTKQPKLLALKDKLPEINHYLGTFEITPNEAASLLNHIPIESCEWDWNNKDVINIQKQKSGAFTLKLPATAFNYPNGPSKV